MKGFHNILVPTDFSESAALAEEFAISLATKFDATITLLHIHTPPVIYTDAMTGFVWPYEELAKQAETALQGAVGDLKKRYPKSEGRLCAGTPWEQIIDSVRELGADLIVMGTHGRRGLPRALLGSVAEKIVRMSPVPVLTVSAPRAEGK